MENKNSDCTLLILTYKGKKHLEFLLPTIATAIENYKGGKNIEVLIVDNGCDEPTRNYVRAFFPQFTYEYSPVNDYLFSLNAFVEKLESEFVFILNDDMKMHPETLNVAIPAIDNDQSLFAVTCRVMDWDGTYTASSVRVVKCSKGWLKHHFTDKDDTEPKYTLYPGGGAAIFRTRMFNEIGGFDPLYRPAYCEDTDLGVIAWQKGWKVVYHPGAILYHREGGTINDQYKQDKLYIMVNKNHILQIVKNTQIPGFLFWFFLLLPYRMVLNVINNRNQFKALWQSITRLPKALARRRQKPLPVIKDDRIWIEWLDKPYVKSQASVIQEMH